MRLSQEGDIFFADYDAIVSDFVDSITSRDPETESAIEATIRWHTEMAGRRG